MKKSIIFLAIAALCLGACQKEAKPLDIKATSDVHDVFDNYLFNWVEGSGLVNVLQDNEYYESLRAWKDAAYDEKGLATRSISYMFFADFGTLRFRFADLPDSLDIINLWGGMPKKGTIDYVEMQACREIKGMRVVGCRITQILATNGNWAFEAEIPSFMDAYYKYIDEHPDLDEQTLENNARTAGCNALKQDMSRNPRATNGQFPEWCVYAAKPLLDEVFEGGIDGYDLDLESNGDPLSGTALQTFVQYLSQFLGPKSENPETLLIFDNPGSYSSWAWGAQYCNFFVSQKYSTNGGASATRASDYPSNLNPASGWVPCQIIPCENVGDTFSQGCNNLEQFANYVHTTTGQRYGHKGGMGSFHGQRDFLMPDDPTNKAEAGKKIPYQHHRYGINAMAKHNYWKPQQ